MPESSHESWHATEDEIDLTELISALWRKKLFIIFVSVSALLFGYMYADSLPKRYQSKATVLLHGQNTNTTIASLLPGAVSSNVDFDTSIKLLTSHQFLQSIIPKLSVPTSISLMSNERLFNVADISQNLTVSKVSATNLLEISFKSIDAQFSAQVVNVITANFIDYKASLLQPGVKKNGVWLDEKIANLQQQLAVEESQLNAFRYENSAIDITNLVKQEQREISMLFNEKRVLNSEREMLERHIEKVKSGNLKHDVNRLLTIKRIADIPIINELLNTLETLKIELSQIKLRYLHKHPKYQAIVLRIDETQRQISTQIEHQLAQDHARLTDVKHLITIINKKKQVAKRKLDKSIIKVGEYEKLQHDIQIHLELLKKLTSRQKQIEVVDNEGSMSSFIIVDPARVELNPVGPKKSLITMLALLLGFMMSCFFALISYFMSANQDRYRQIVADHNFTVLGKLPEVKVVRAKEPIVSGKGKRFAAYQEAIRSIRTNYMVSKGSIENRLIAVTSLTPNEGKSSCCLQLARSFSELERVIIIDADLRAPSIAKVLGESPHRLGLSNLIAGTHSFEQCVFNSDELNADVLSSGIKPQNALLFLSSKRFSLLLKALLKKYDRVILECPPLLSVSDALVIAKNIQGVTLVADVTKSSTAQFIKNMHELQHSNIDIAGVILNRVKHNEQHYYGTNSPVNVNSSRANV